jgi:hypothetical protein
MSSGPTGWLPLILTTFGAGVAGSIIATYGGQSRERRKARSEVMASLEKLESARLTRPGIEAFDYDDTDMAELVARCVLAGVPRYLVSLYELANAAPRYLGTPDSNRHNQPAVATRLDDARHRYARVLADDARSQLARAVWHPWLSAIFWRPRARRVRKQIIRVYPQGEVTKMRAHVLSEWESARTARDEWLRRLKDQEASEYSGPA